MHCILILSKLIICIFITYLQYVSSCIQLCDYTCLSGESKESVHAVSGAVVCVDLGVNCDVI